MKHISWVEYAAKCPERAIVDTPRAGNMSGDPESGEEHYCGLRLPDRVKCSREACWLYDVEETYMETEI